MDEAINCAFPAARLAFAMLAQPSFIGRPVAGLILADYLKDARQDGVTAHEPVPEQVLQDAVPALLR